MIIMKNILYILFLFCSLNIVAQNKQIQTDQKQIATLQDSISTINENSKKQADKIDLLEQRISQASDTINNQNSLLGGFETIYAIISIVIALLGIGLPLVTYFFGIKPSQDAVKELENNVDKKLAQYLANSRKKRVDEAINNLKSQNTELINNAINYISVTQHDGFTDEQIYKIVLLLKNDNISDNIKITLAHVLTNRKIDIATEYFLNKITDKNSNFKYPAIKYFISTTPEYADEILKQAIKTDDCYSNFVYYLSVAGGINKSLVLNQINNKEIIDLINLNDLKQMQYFSNMIASFQISSDDFNNSYLNKKIIEANQ